MRQFLASAVFVVLIAGCASINPTQSPRQGYRVAHSPEMSTADAERALVKSIAATPASSLGELDAAPKLVHSVLPVTPKAAIENGVYFGMVKLEIDVDESGRVYNVTVMNSPYPPFAEAAVAAVKQWQFAPMTAKGKPTVFRILHDIYFRMAM